MILSTAQAAKELGISRRRVTWLIHKGRLPALKLGPFYVILSEDLEPLRVRRGPGRPKASGAHPSPDKKHTETE